MSENSPAKKVLIITASSKKDGSPDGHLLRALDEQLGNNCLTAFLGAEKDAQFTIPYCPPLDRLSPYPISRETQRWHWALRRIFFKQLKSLVDQIADFAKRENIGKIISILDSPATIWLTRRVASALNVPYATFTSNVPETMLVLTGYDMHSAKQMIAEYNQTVAGASPAVFCTEEMKAHYEKNLKISAVPLEDPFLALDSIHDRAGNAVQIGCILSQRFKNEIAALIATLHENQWQLGDRKLSLKLIGSITGMAFNFEGKPADIEIVSGLDDERITEELSLCTVNFVPSWTNPNFTASARLCLPENMSFYLSARRPLLVQTLQPSLAHSLVSDYKLGETVPSNNLLPALKRLLAEPDQETADSYKRLEGDRFSSQQFNANIALMLKN